MALTCLRSVQLSQPGTSTASLLNWGSLSQMLSHDDWDNKYWRKREKMKTVQSPEETGVKTKFACHLIWVHWLSVIRERTECGLYEGFKFRIPKLQFFSNTCFTIWYMTSPFSWGRKTTQCTFLCSHQWNLYLTLQFLIWTCTLKMTSEDKLDIWLEDCYPSEMIL